MTDHQTPLSDDELLSAYLDGELAGDDLARAERLLAEQPASRQLLAELRALGEGLRALPVGQLGEGFPQRVLRRAERQLLSESHVSTAPPADKPPARWRNKRPWIYAAASLAAGLLVAVVSLPHRSTKPPAAAAEHAAADQFAHHAPESAYPAAAASSPSALAAKPSSAPVPPEQQVGLQVALTQLGLVPVDAKAIALQLELSEAQAPATQPLAVWSCIVAADTLEHDSLQRVLARHALRVVEQWPLSLESTTTAPAAGAHLPAANPSASHAPVMAVLVAGDPQQLDATLTDLRSRSGTFQQLTDLGRKSLRDRPTREPAARTGAAKSREMPPPPQAKREAAGGRQPKNQARSEKSKAPRSIHKEQSPSQFVLFILRRAAPVSPASPPAPGNPTPAQQGPDKE